MRALKKVTSKSYFAGESESVVQLVTLSNVCKVKPSHLGPKGREVNKADLLPLCLFFSWLEDTRHHPSLLSWAVDQLFQAVSQPTQPVILARAEAMFPLDTMSQEF